jgi:4'-phosphopantetheinyl transferase
MPTLHENEIHVWASWLDISPPKCAKLAEGLSQDERKRALRFKFQQHQTRFTAGRAFLRMILGRYLPIGSAQVEFQYNPQGKPEVSPTCNPSGLRFNFTHSESLALIAITKIGPLGIDIERLRAIEGAEELAEGFCSQRELKVFKDLTSDEKQLAFYNLWTRKESFLKATGEGITHLLRKVEVVFCPGEQIRFIALPGGSTRGSRWRLYNLSSADDFVGAITIMSENDRVRVWDVDLNYF